YYTMELYNVHWRSTNANTTLESRLETSLIETVQEVAGLDVCGWKRSGIGDLLAQARWMADFPQAKPVVTNVRAQARLGLSFPTGKKQDEDKILAFPFGND